MKGRPIKNVSLLESGRFNESERFHFILLLHATMLDTEVVDVLNSL